MKMITIPWKFITKRLALSLALITVVFIFSGCTTSYKMKGQPEHIPPSKEAPAWILWVHSMMLTEKISDVSWSPKETVTSLSECNREKHNYYITYSTYTPRGSTSVVPDKQVSTRLEGGGLLDYELLCLPANIDPRNP